MSSRDDMPLVPLPRGGDNLPAIPGEKLPTHEWRPPRVSWDLMLSGRAPFVYLPEGVSERPKITEKLAALLTRRGIADVNAWEDLHAACGTGARLWVVDRSGERWEVLGVDFDYGSETGRLRVRHLGPRSREGELLIDIHQAFGRMLPVVVYKPTRRNALDPRITGAISEIPRKKLWHVTRKAKFRVDHKKGGFRAVGLGEPTTDLYMADSDSLYTWSAHPYLKGRRYVAEIDVGDLPHLYVPFGGDQPSEYIVESTPKIKVVRVLPLDEALEEAERERQVHSAWLKRHTTVVPDKHGRGLTLVWTATGEPFFAEESDAAIRLAEHGPGYRRRNSGDEGLRKLERAARSEHGSRATIKRYFQALARLGENRGLLPCPWCFDPGLATVYPSLDYADCKACGTGWRVSENQKLRGWPKRENLRRNSDESRRGLERRVATGDRAARKQLYFDRLRAGDAYRVASDASEEFEVLEMLLEDGDLSEAEVLRRHEERVRAHRHTTREYWLIHHLGQVTGLANPEGHLVAMRIARLMRQVDLDPWGQNPSERIEDISAILGCSRGAWGVDAFDGKDEEGAPKFVYVVRESWAEPTLLWDFMDNKFKIRTTNQMASHSLGRLGGAESDWR